MQETGEKRREGENGREREREEEREGARARNGRGEEEAKKTDVGTNCEGKARSGKRESDGTRATTLCKNEDRLHCVCMRNGRERGGRSASVYSLNTRREKADRNGERKGRGEREGDREREHAAVV